jgi:hypothetical protein
MKLVKEHIKFERNQDPLDAMRLGKNKTAIVTLDSNDGATITFNDKTASFNSDIFSNDIWEKMMDDDDLFIKLYWGKIFELAYSLGARNVYSVEDEQTYSVTTGEIVENDK